MAPSKKTKPIEPSPAAAARKPPVKRRQVNIADDADQVLSKCRQLRDALRRKSSSLPTGLSSDDDEEAWNLDKNNDDEGEKDGTKKAGGAKTKRIRLSELKRGSASTATEVDGKKSTIVEVAEMNSTQVVEGIENVAVMIARQVLAKQVSCVY